MELDGDYFLTQKGFIEEFCEQHKADENRPFCFILGAGASVESGIPMGDSMARDWLKMLHQRRDEQSNRSLKDWLESEDCHLGIEGLTEANCVDFYSSLYDKRYGNNPKAGHDYLESKMKDKEPSIGYYILAHLMSNTQHNIVVTTNFDNLVADALFFSGDVSPKLIVHESLCEFLDVNSTRPVVAKIHGHLGFAPKNTDGELGSLPKAWERTLKLILDRYIPVVIGYSGNDQSLMSALEKHKPSPARPLYWCEHCPDGKLTSLSKKLPTRVAKSGDGMNARFIPVEGFDMLMLKIYHALYKNDARELVSSIENIALTKAKKLGEKADKKIENIVSSGGRNVKEDLLETVSNLSSKPSSSKVRSWWSWQIEINKSESIEEKDSGYKKAIDALPESHELMGNYAVFLHNVRKDSEEAEVHYKRALEIEPEHANTHRNYAVFLHDVQKDYEEAEAHHKRALEIEPEHANTHGNYASFLHEVLKDYEEAEVHYKRALEIEPEDANTLANYGQFLLGEGRHIEGKEFLVKALAVVDKNSNQLKAELLVSLWLANSLLDEVDNGILSKYKAMIEFGFIRQEWNFDRILMHFEGRSDRDFAHALTNAFLDESKVEALEEFEEWKKA